jgi:pyruvate/2-oxoglutarate/acetoin dehydrogenase E1 component
MFVGVSRGMLEEFGEKRIVETSISETAFTGAGVGAAFMGLRPTLKLCSEILFPLRLTRSSTTQQISFMTAGKVHAPLVLRTPFGSGTGAAAQHFPVIGKFISEYPRAKSHYAFNPL